MKILFSSYSFSPNIGGLELVSELLCREFSALGDQVVLVTDTEHSGKSVFPFPVVRKPSWKKLLNLYRWCDIFYHNHLSLNYAWPIFLCERRPWVVSFQTYLSPESDGKTWKVSLKKMVLQRAYRIALNEKMRAMYDAQCVLPSPYDERVFRAFPEVERNRDILFVGRLVSDKGADILIKSLALMRDAGVLCVASIVGSGPEEENLKGMVRAMGLEGRVRFYGSQQRERVVHLFNSHRILVIPSIWAEPFGVVALEAAACGCVPVGSNIGGIPDAIGPGGVVFPPGDYRALAERLRNLLSDNVGLERYAGLGKKHVQDFTAKCLARRFRQVLDQQIRDFPTNCEK